MPVTIPVNTSDLTGLGVIAADFTFNYDPAVLSPNPADISVTAGTVNPGAMVNANTSVSGSVVVSVFSAGAFAGAGTVVDLHMKVIGPINSVTPLTLTNFRYNGNNVCSNSMSGMLTVVSGAVTGRVAFENEPFPIPTISPTPTPRPVPNTKLNAAGGTSFFSLADASGNYSLSGFGPGAYTVTPSRADESNLIPTGIFSNDAALISRHVVGLITLNATQQKAADVSGFHALSSFDAALIAQWIVGIPNALNHTGQWVFTPVSTNPDTTIDSVQDYKALLLGDVSGDWMPPSSRPLESVKPDLKYAVRVSVPSVKAPVGSQVAMPLKIGNLQGRGVSSYQFDIEYDPSVIAPAEIAADLAGTLSEGMSVVYNSPSPGLLKVAVFGVAPFSNDGVFLYLRFLTIGKAGSGTTLTISGLRLNDGTGDVLVTSGRLHIIR